MRLVLLPLLVLVLAGCSSGEDAACTLVDADSKVGVVWKPDDFKDASPAVFRLCVGDTCTQRTVTADGDPFGSLSVALPDSQGAGTVPVRLTVTADSGTRVVDDRKDARLTEQHPNGKGCGPTVWTATFRAKPDEGLTSPDGMSLR
ncbi:hypothetical protein [Streptomyces liangshanensis]|uniref:hypothetical protein n=1 Tax=Streptomyces liangshanensis TaxID=2717324 RepID=UPI0036DB6C25